jgi:peptidoglycan hydrolase-like protein with peptidoglycan-binding domain
MARMPRLIRCAGAALVLLALVPAVAAARGSNANVAALQVALRALHHYSGAIDGLRGAGTKGAVRRFQRSHHLPVDGVAGPRTRRALGRRGAPLLGSRVMGSGDRGWDVAALQFMLQRRGYSPGSVDGGYGPATAATVARFQAAVGLAADGHAGSSTLRAMRHHIQRRTSPVPTGASGPVRFLRPLNVPMGDGFGYPGGRRHDGIDFPAPMGVPIGAAGVGTVTFAGWNTGGYGNLVVVRHRLGFETWYAHLSRFAVSSGSRVAGGVRIGYVGSTGHSTGPHLHFEVRLNGFPINPAPLLLAASSLGKVQARRTPPERHLDCPTGKRRPLTPGRETPRRALLAC